MITMIMLLSERRSPAATAATAACKSSGNRSFNCLMTPVWAYNGSMSRYRLYPTPEQEVLLLEACGHARFVWNLGLEQRLMWRRERGPTPGYLEQCRQLTEARAAEPWLGAVAQVVQQQALRDLDRAWRNFFAGTHRRPTWRKAGRSEGFRIVNAQRMPSRRLSRNVGVVKIPRIGWVRFRWSRAVPDAKSYRVTLDRSGRWHVAFAAIPTPIAGPGTGDVVGVDRGVRVAAALSTGELSCPAGLHAKEAERLLRLQRKLARAKRGSGRRGQVKLAIAKLKAAEKDRRKDWAEKLSTDLARRFDVIRVEDLRIASMTGSVKGTIAKPGRNVSQKAGLNRGILGAGWGLLAKRLEDKAPGRVEKVPAPFTSQRCSACGHVASENRKSQAVFACTACGFACNADVNAALNIAAGHVVTARGDRAKSARSVKREPRTARLQSVA